jgi:hypothetical protein
VIPLHWAVYEGGPFPFAVPIAFVITALVDTIVDKFSIAYAVTCTPLGANAVAYYTFAGSFPVTRAVLRLDKGCINDVLVYRVDRHRGIATALCDLIEGDLGRPLVPSRIRSKAVRAFWASHSPRPAFANDREWPPVIPRRTWSYETRAARFGKNPFSWPEVRLCGILELTLQPDPDVAHDPSVPCMTSSSQPQL